MFGVTKRRLTKRDAKRCHQICIEQGGTGFIGPVDLAGNVTKGWFTCENLGWGHDDVIAKRVLEAVRVAGIDL